MTMSTSALEQQHPWARFHALNYPVRLDALGEILEEIRVSHSPHRDQAGPATGDQLIGNSADIQMVRKLLQQVAPTMATVLITGDSGTGKEVVARQIHEQSGREGAFVAINCGAIPHHLLESELFGHERGAFTGAVAARAGRFELARGGTFFLDEIGDMPLIMQVKLLRVLEERVLERVGGTKTIPVDVRIIAATHRDLQACIAGGEFREDLYYRLSVFPVEISPLKDRPEDIAPLAEEIIRRIRRNHRVNLYVADEAMEILENYAWPGNVRELANLIERLAVIVPNGLVKAADLPWPLNPRQDCSELPDVVDISLTPSLRSEQVNLPADGIDLKEYLAAVEKSMIDAALEKTNGVAQQAANLLGIGRTTLVEKVRRYDLKRS